MENLFDLNTLSGNIINEESELIPLMTSDDEEAINKEKLPKSLSILPLKNTVLFPGVVIPITATRNKSVKLIKAANKGDKLIGVVSQINNKVSDPKIGDINNIGTVAKILRVLQMPDGNLTIIIQGKKRFQIKNIVSEDPFILSSVEENKEFNPELEKAGRLADFIELGELMAIDALDREESCGGHFREEHQTDENEAKRNDDDYAYVAAWEKINKEYKLHKEKLDFENVELTTRSYK